MYFMVAYEHEQGLQSFTFHNHEIFQSDSVDAAGFYLGYAQRICPDKDWKLYSATFVPVV